MKFFQHKKLDYLKEFLSYLEELNKILEEQYDDKLSKIGNDIFKIIDE